MKSKRNFHKLYILYFFPLYFLQIFFGLYKFKHFQVIAAFLARHYRNQLNPQEKAARAIFPRHNYLY